MNKIVDKDSFIPLYLQVERKIKELLSCSPYNHGEFLPGEFELKDIFGVSRHTIRKAMDNLVNENIIIREKGRGTRINLEKNRVKTTLSDWHSFTDEMNKKGNRFLFSDKKVEMAIPNKEVIEKLELTSDKKIVKLLKIKGEIEPEVVFICYFHPSLKLDKDEKFMSADFKKLYHYLEENYKINFKTSKEEISAIMPNSELKKLLKITDSKTPVLCRKRLVISKNRGIIEYNIGYYRSDKFVYNINIIK